MTKQNQTATQTPLYKTGPGSYNRESGNKTLALVAVLIVIITILVVITMVLINRRSSVMVKGTATPITTTH